MPKHRNKMITDKETDYIFHHLMNEEKINEQLKEEFDAEQERNLARQEYPKLDSRITTETVNRAKKSNKSSSEKDKELPSSSEDTPKNKLRKNVDFNTNSSISPSVSVSVSTSTSSTNTPYKNKINAKHKQEHNHKQESKHKADNKSKVRRDNLRKKLEEDVKVYVETAEEKRARSREEHTKLQELVEKHNVKLTKKYTIHDDPDEMKEEYDMWMDKRNKNNQVKFYKNVLLNIVCGAEFLNGKYNPFEFKLQDWSKQVASDMDDYTELLEEIYEKYKDKGGKMAPEIKLIFLLIMSGVSFHLSKSLFSEEGLTKTLKNNPSIINKFISGFSASNKNSGTTSETPGSKKKLLDIIRKQNNNPSSAHSTTHSASQSSTQSETQSTSQSDTKSENGKIINNELVTAERERRLEAERRIAVMERQNEMLLAQFENMRNHQLSQQSPQFQPQNLSNNYNSPPYSTTNNNYSTNNNLSPRDERNQILSDVNTKPRFQNNPILSNIGDQDDDINSLFTNGDDADGDGEVDSDTISDNKTNDDTHITDDKTDETTLDSLGESEDLTFDEIIKSSSKNIVSNTKPSSFKSTTSNTKPKSTSSTRTPVSKTITNNKGKGKGKPKSKRNQSSFTDSLTPSKKNSNVFKL